VYEFFKPKMNDFSARLKRFIDECNWIFAKTYARTWPHEYIVDERVDGVSFNELAAHIDKFGYQSEFYSTIQTYFGYDGNTYWHMGNIINRCPEAETYRRRKAENRLPENTME
jgi:hypothetical protein